MSEVDGLRNVSCVMHTVNENYRIVRPMKEVLVALPIVLRLFGRV